MAEPDGNARNWAVLCHLSALAYFAMRGFGQIVGPLVIWIWLREKYPLVDEQGKESVNFQITMTILGAAGELIWSAGVEWGSKIFAAAAILDLCLTVYAALQVRKGKPFRYPWSLKFVH